MVPIFLAALWWSGGSRRSCTAVPALRQVPVAGLLQATSLPFIVAATAIGVRLGLVNEAESAALIAAGLLSVLIFPLAGLTLLRRLGMAPTADATEGATPSEESPQMAM